ncbi:class I SAM-dependent methyltransferase [Sphingomonas sp. ID0503]|uniref:class I SAM-dependent methyltransferase n=1 Tax=Sphingomonas sp. ID0503 TaxID=3399691 RepID=UPI003AFAAF5B
MNIARRFRKQFEMAGTVKLDACPLCGSKDTALLWQLPQNRLPANTRLSAPGTSLDQLYLDYLPTLEAPQKLFRFDICGACETIFLNPKEDDHAVYKRDVSKVESFRRLGTKEFVTSSNEYLSHLPVGSKCVVDLACGAGQALHVMRDARPDLRYIGLELSEPSVAFMRDELGFEAHTVDLDNDDLDSIIPPGSVDFVIAQEAYEHVRDPITLVQKAARMLRPGGRMWLTAQYWGDNALVIRVGEPVYINEIGFRLTLERSGLRVLKMRRDVKIRALLEKPADTATADGSFDWAASKVVKKPSSAKTKKKPGWRKRLKRLFSR